MLMHVPTAIIALIDWSRRVPGPGSPGFTTIMFFDVYGFCFGF